MKTAFDLVERGWVPDVAVRAGIRELVRRRRRSLHSDLPPTAIDADFAAKLRQSPVAVATAEANEQHYEVPAPFFEKVLGTHLKYSCCYYPNGDETLDQAETAMLELTCERADLVDGQKILELGCGWGSLTVWMASHYPNSEIIAVSNSHSQREHIGRRCRSLGLTNVQVLTADANDLAEHSHERIGDGAFDRVVSVEMFEHMRNWPQLLARIAGWLTPAGRLFLHVFCHRQHPYLYEDRGPNDWMARHFFTGGMMPSDDLLLQFQDHLQIEDRWSVDGRHYQRTANHWLEQLDQQRDEILPILSQTYGHQEAHRWLQRWRLFFMGCAETFGDQGGQEWRVAHYRLRPLAETMA
ncbi:MAG: class I SAM-dependent methyltransferase [Gemmatimonadetes bacterium]|jgi:cyclopropane-fatty-acyl-phospholipid synthase|nr:class I SAM-dependent methyltransferase [Gemmatimonadota bacterium]MBT6146521.1 class I SAM-dependent methyltransferase [Gemmatimonadota bacterium]MBT7860189.1 class I SAM-dependent methyltransferase [Gemmatimonadota bacterium]